MNSLRPFAQQGRFIFSQGKRWMSGLTDEHRALQPIAGVKTAGWLIGHLSVTGDFGRRICGLTPMCSKEWRPLFNPGTFPSLDPSVYPPMTELLDTWVAVYKDFFANAPDATDDILAMPNPYTLAITAFPTSGDFASYLMTGHLGHHMGQLGSWHAAAGLARPVAD
jgi:hypothetical protein